jgi:hypothetical protein
MAFLISHRGNTIGINTKKENSIPYIQETIEKGFHVVVDTWIIGNEHLALGSDRPQYTTNLDFLKNEYIICRAKCQNTFQFLLDSGVHCFAHEYDPFVLTSGGMIWTRPGGKIPVRGICNMPEYTFEHPKMSANILCAGICSNFIECIKEEIEQNKLVFSQKKAIVSEDGSL